jgi:hypothetical protein
MQTNDRNVILRMVVDIALALHLAAAAGYLWLSPKGFPLSSDRFWMNSVLPAVLIAITSAGLVAMHRHQWSAAASAVLFFATMWLAGAISGRIVFPISLRGIWVPRSSSPLPDSFVFGGSFAANTARINFGL